MSGNLTGEVKADFEKLLDWMNEYGYVRMEWVEYWYNDQNETDRITLYHKDGKEYDAQYDEYPGEDIIETGEVQELIYNIFGSHNDTGVFEINALEGTITKTADAIMPDPELEIEALDDPKRFSLGEVE